MTLGVHRANGPLGHWTIVEARHARLAGVVERMWHFRGRTALPRERVMPNGLLELIVHLGPRYGIVERHRIERCAALSLSGLQTRAVIVAAPDAPGAVLGIQLTPAGAYAVLGTPLHELTGRDVDLEALLGSMASELEERCYESGSAEACLDTAARWVLARLKRARSTDAAIEWVAARIRDRHGNVPIEALRERTGMTKTRLATAFREQIGVTPKVYARIARFKRAITCLHEKPRSLSALAADAGYYDQPHFTAEFRQFSGLTPGEFLAAIHYETGVNVAEP